MAQYKDETSLEKETLHQSRRKFFKRSTALTTVALIPSKILKAAEDKVDEKVAEHFEQQTLRLRWYPHFNIINAEA
jgi:hypothetical protein